MDKWAGARVLREVSSSNYTIDDSQWNTPALSLSPGWNMLRTGSAEYISAEEVEMMRPLLSGFHNSSYSWNTHAGCSNTLSFVGGSSSPYRAHAEQGRLG